MNRDNADLIKQNVELLEECNRLYGELDHFRGALVRLQDHPGEAGKIARAALAMRNFVN